MTSTYDFLKQEAASHFQSIERIVIHLQQVYNETGDDQAKMVLDSLLGNFQTSTFFGSPATGKNLLKKDENSFQGPPESKALKTRGGRPKIAGKVISKAFIYSGESGRLMMFCQGLKALGWIAAETDDQVFVNLFSGGETRQRIIWKGDTNTLAALFKRLVKERGLVSLPDKLSLWVMVSGHFWNQVRGQVFEPDRLRSTHTPKENDQTIAYLVNILDPDVSMDKVRKMMESQR